MKKQQKNRRGALKRTLTPSVPILTAIVFALFSVACSKSVPPTVNSLADVTGKRIGYITGSIGEIYAGKIGQAAPYASEATLAADISAGVVDCAVADPASAEKIAASAKGLSILSDSAISFDMRIAVNAVYPDMLQAINTALNKMKADGTISSMRASYLAGKKPEGQIAPGFGEGLILAVPDESKPPYVMYKSSESSAGPEVEGLSVSIAENICAALGMSLRIERIPGAKIMNTLRLGRAESSYFAMCWEFYGMETDSTAIFSEVYDTVNLKVITRIG